MLYSYLKTAETVHAIVEAATVSKVKQAAKLLLVAILEEAAALVKPDMVGANYLTDSEYAFLKKGEKLQAIKSVYERKGWGLKDAKEYVEAIALALNLAYLTDNGIVVMNNRL